MNPSDVYFMRDEESDGFFLVTKEFWKQHKYIDDCELGSEVCDILPDGFSQEVESYFQYYEGDFEENPEKGFAILQSLGIQEIVWGQDEPLPLPLPIEWDYSKDTPEDLLQASLDILRHAKHSDFGTPSLLIKRITKYLER